MRFPSTERGVSSALAITRHSLMRCQSGRQMESGPPDLFTFSEDGGDHLAFLGRISPGIRKIGAHKSDGGLGSFAHPVCFFRADYTALGRSAFHEKAGQSQDSFVFTYLDSFLRAEPPLSPSFHPQSVMSDSRSLQGGRTQFSRCCYLIIDLAPIFGRGGGARHLSQSPDLGG